MDVVGIQLVPQVITCNTYTGLTAYVGDYMQANFFL